MIQDVKKFIEPYVALDMPIPYKDLRIQPILMKDVNEFLYANDILDIVKNEIADVEIIQMTYLQYIIQKLMFDETMFDSNLSNGDIWKYKFIVILQLCLGVDASEVSIDKNNNRLIIGENEITSNDFDDIRKIIMYQNVINFDDTPMSKDYKEMLNKYYSIKNVGIAMPTLEDKVDVVLANTAYTSQTLREMTYRRFQKIFEKIIDKTEYIVGAMFKSQGAKEPLEHWVYKKKKDKYSDVFSKMDTFKQI